MLTICQLCFRLRLAIELLLPFYRATHWNLKNMFYRFTTENKFLVGNGKKYLLNHYALSSSFQNCSGLPDHWRNQWWHIRVHHRFRHDVGWVQLETQLPLVPGSTAWAGQTERGPIPTCQVRFPVRLIRMHNTRFMPRAFGFYSKFTFTLN